MLNSDSAPFSRCDIFLIDDQLEDYALSLPADELAKINLRVKHPETRRHKIAARLALKRLLNEQAYAYKGLEKDKKGIPIHHELAISISHKGKYAIAASTKKYRQLGVDLEFIENIKAKKLARKFLHPDELSLWESSVSSCSKAWAAKEALYKMLQTPGIHFAEQLRLYPINDNVWKANIYLNESLIETEVHFKQHQEMLIAQAAYTPKKAFL